MEISSKPVGALSHQFRTAVTWRKTTNFAAGVGDCNPFYFDDEREEGLIAPPMLATSLTWPISRNIASSWDADLDPSLFNRQVHFTEYLKWHRVMRPGDDLRIQGELAGVGPCRGGSLVVVRYCAYNMDNELVFEEFSGALLRGVRCPEGLKTSCELPKSPETIFSSNPEWIQPIEIDILASYVYDGCADIPFPIHTSPTFAKSVGLPGIIIHGTQTLTLALREIVNQEAAGDPRRLRSAYCCFCGRVVPGTTIHVRALEKRKEGEETLVFFDVLNGEGKRAICDGCAVISTPLS